VIGVVAVITILVKGEQIQLFVPFIRSFRHKKLSHLAENANAEWVPYWTWSKSRRRTRCGRGTFQATASRRGQMVVFSGKVSQLLRARPSGRSERIGR
jgi:hypothetical protein